MNVYYLGPEGSYSSILAHQEFTDPHYSCIPCDSFLSIIDTVMKDSTAVGILPLENSITSNVHENIDTLFSTRLYIVGESYLQVRLHVLGLLGSKKDTIQRVYSHPKALAQCSKWIADHNLEAVPCQSTSEACARLLQENESQNAVIGARLLADIEGITLLETDVGNVEYNTTRFVFVSQNRYALTYPAIKKVSLTFKTLHRPGSLAHILGELAKIGVNLTKIVSQPIPGSDFEYQFWIDLEAEPEIIEKALDLMGTITGEYSIIGSYIPGKRHAS